jgi:hypothetical protein
MYFVVVLRFYLIKPGTSVDIISSRMESCAAEGWIDIFFVAIIFYNVTFEVGCKVTKITFLSILTFL